MSQEYAYEALRNAIEVAIDRKMRSPRDFDFLAEAVFEKLHLPISSSTLKRFWGYIPQYASVRTSTLDLLSRFIDYKDWEEFLEKNGLQTQQPPIIPQRGMAATNTPLRGVTGGFLRGVTGGFLRGVTGGFLLGLIALLALLLVGGAYLFFAHRTNDPLSDGKPYILRRGQIFETSSDYLRLFGITTTENYWDQPLPHHEGIFIWGPEYHHPQWHNDGQRDSLMPTITEWWSPADGLDDEEASALSEDSMEKRRLLTIERNEHLYFTVIRTNELRITFMKNLTDTGYVFLGVYRTSLSQSDSTHVVWERVADECDLSNLAYLQQLRH